MAKIVVRLPEPKTDYDVSNQKQINRATMTITDASSAIFSLFKTKTIAANATTEMISQPIILLENEILKAQATTADRLHVVVSLLEINRD